MILGLFLLFASFAAAGDLTGTWTGTLNVKRPDGEVVTVPITAQLDQKGQELTGTIGTGQRQGDIKNAKFDGNQITFDVMDSESEGPAKFKVTASEDKIEGEMLRQASEGETRTGRIMLSRTR